MSATILNPNQVPGGTTLPAGDLNASTNTLEKIYKRPVKDISAPAVISGAALWDYLNNFTANGNRVTRNSSNTTSNGALSSQILYEVSTVKFTVPASMAGQNNFAVGFHTANTLSGWQPLPYCFYFAANENGNSVTIKELGNEQFNLGIGQWNTGTVLEIRRNDGIISYYRNNILIYTSTVTSSAALRVGVYSYFGDTFIEGIEAIDGQVDFLLDKSLLWWKTLPNRFENVSLADLKAALNALP